MLWAAVAGAEARGLVGKLKVSEKQEYGRMEIEVEMDSGLFGFKNVGDGQIVRMSHGDEAVRFPGGFEVVARSQRWAVAALDNLGRRFYGLQYHPEGQCWLDNG